MIKTQNDSAQWIEKRQITGHSSGFDIQVTISDNLGMEFRCYHQKESTLYCLRLDDNDLKKQNIVNGVNFIESSSELYQYLDMITRENPGKFQDYVKIIKDHLIINIQFKIDFKMGSKKKVLFYQFVLKKQHLSEITKLSTQINQLNKEKEDHKRSTNEQFAILQKQNQKYRQEMKIMNQNLISMMKLGQGGNDAYGNSFKFHKNSPNLVIKNDYIIQTANKLNSLLFCEALDHQHVFEWKMRIQGKQNIYIGISTTEIFKEETEEVLRVNRLLKNETLKANSIITMTFNSNELKYAIEYRDADSDEQNEQICLWAYNKRAQSIKCKQLIKSYTYYPCMVMSLGAKMLFLAFTKTKKTY